MTEAERLAERLDATRMESIHYTTNATAPAIHFPVSVPINPDGPEAAALIRSQAEELERLRRALRETQKPKLITPVAVLNDDGSQSFSSQALGER